MPYAKYLDEYLQILAVSELRPKELMRNLHEIP
jgi:hypothetical protein